MCIASRQTHLANERGNEIPKPKPSAWDRIARKSRSSRLAAARTFDPSKQLSALAFLARSMILRRLASSCTQTPLKASRTPHRGNVGSSREPIDGADFPDLKSNTKRLRVTCHVLFQFSGVPCDRIAAPLIAASVVPCRDSVKVPVVFLRRLRTLFRTRGTCSRVSLGLAAAAHSSDHQREILKLASVAATTPAVWAVRCSVLLARSSQKTK